MLLPEALASYLSLEIKIGGTMTAAEELLQIVDIGKGTVDIITLLRKYSSSSAVSASASSSSSSSSSSQHPDGCTQVQVLRYDGLSDAGGGKLDALILRYATDDLSKAKFDSFCNWKSLRTVETQRTGQVNRSFGS